MAIDCVNNYQKNNNYNNYNQTNLLTNKNVKKLSNSAIDVTSLPLISSVNHLETQKQTSNLFDFDMHETIQLYPFTTSSTLTDNNIINKENKYNTLNNCLVENNKHSSIIPTIFCSEYDENNKNINSINQHDSIDFNDYVENNKLNKTASTVTISSLLSRPNSLSSVQKLIYENGIISNKKSINVSQYFANNGIVKQIINNNENTELKTKVEYKQFYSNNNLNYNSVNDQLKK